MRTVPKLSGRSIANGVTFSQVAFKRIEDVFREFHAARVSIKALKLHM